MFKSVPHLLFNSIKNYPDNIVFKFKKDGQIRSITYFELGEQIRNLSHGLLDTGVKKGDRIAILSNNRPEWAVSDFSAFCIQAIVVPIYQTLPANQIAYILKDSKARAIFVENASQYNKILEIKDSLPALQFIISFDEIDPSKNQVIKYSELLETGAQKRKTNPDYFDTLLDSIQSDEICTFVYTSGTTGEPKGVMLHHKGFIKDIIHSEAVLNLYPDDVFLSFLPLSHLYERLAGHWCPMYKGATVYYAQSIDTVINDIAEARPTVMVSVPRLYEKVAGAVREKIERGPALKRNLFYWAIGTGLEYHEKRIAGTLDKWLERRYRIADKVVFMKIKNKLGGRFRCPIAGGAPLSVDTLKFFEAIGLRIIEGYGMTETHLIITLTPPGKTKYGSCGKPIQGVKVKIARDGEVLIKGETVMAGYYNKKELTREAIDEKGWLHTGDVGYLDEDNYLFLTDRKKNIIITSGGKNVAPAPIEHILKTSTYIDDICLLGNGRRFISAIIIPNYELLKKYATEQGFTVTSNEELVKNEQIIKLIETEITRLQSSFASYETVKKFFMLSEPLSIERGELTPSLKIKRNVLEQKFKKQIDMMYRES